MQNINNKLLCYLVLLNTFNIFVLLVERKVCPFPIKASCVSILFLCIVCAYFLKYAYLHVFSQSVQSCNFHPASADNYVFLFSERSWQRSNISVQSMTQRVKPAQRRAAPTQPCWLSFVCSGKQRLHHRPDRQKTE